MWKPKYFQVMTTNSDIMTVDGSASQVDCSDSSPIAPRIWFASPPSGERIIPNRTPVITSDSTYGAKNSSR